jgi:hypothetical protein
MFFFFNHRTLAGGDRDVRGATRECLAEDVYNLGLGGGIARGIRRLSLCRQILHFDLLLFELSECILLLLLLLL